MRPIIVDANIAFSTLVRNQGDLRARFDSPQDARFIAPRFVIVEIFKYKEQILRKSGLTEEELLTALYALVSCLEFVDEKTIPIGTWLEARRLCAPTDPKDTPYVALALHHDAELWTRDDELKEGLRARGFSKFYEP